MKNWLIKIKNKLSSQDNQCEPHSVDLVIDNTVEAAPEWEPSLDLTTSGWFSKETRELVPGFVINPGDLVLDVGCGDGPFPSFVAGMGADLYFCDIDEETVKNTNNNIKNQTNGGHFGGFVTNGEPLPIKSSSMDKVMMMEVLEHVDSPSNYVRELVRVAKPGATFLITVPDIRMETIQKDLAPDSYFEKPNHIRIFSREDFQELITDAGLVIEKTDYHGFYWSIWWSFFWACKHDIMEPWHPLLVQWTDTWNTLLSLEDGPRIKRVLDSHLPKSQIIIASKPISKKIQMDNDR